MRLHDDISQAEGEHGSSMAVVVQPPETSTQTPMRSPTNEVVGFVVRTLNDTIYS